MGNESEASVASDNLITLNLNACLSVQFEFFELETVFPF